MLGSDKDGVEVRNHWVSRKDGWFSGVGKMISLPEFHKHFVGRHDFDSPDLNVLEHRFSRIQFNAIPEAWICEIDKALSKMEAPNKVLSISQVMGFVTIQLRQFDTLSNNDLLVLKSLETRLEDIDIDLRKELDSGILLH